MLRITLGVILLWRFGVVQLEQKEYWDDLVTAAANRAVGNNRPDFSWDDPSNVAQVVAGDLYKRDGQGILWRLENGSWWKWNGKIYQPYGDVQVEHDVQLWLEARKRGQAGTLISKSSTHFIREITWNLAGWLELRRRTGTDHDPPIPLWLDNVMPDHPHYVSAANGIVDLGPHLDRGEPPEIYDPSPLWFSNTTLGYEFDWSADCPLWRRVIDENLRGDQDAVSLVQEWFGYCLTSDISLSRSLFLIGASGTGKSIASTVLTELLGPENVTATPLEDFGRKFVIADKVGKLLNVCGEVGDLNPRALDTYKRISGGDHVNLEKKGKDILSVRLCLRFMCMANNMPSFHDRSEAFWRRMILLPFDRVVENPDTRLVDSKRPNWPFRHELPGIFNWAVQGLRRLLQQGTFTIPSCAVTASERGKMRVDPLGTFIKTYFVPDPQGVVSKTSVYLLFQRWCEIHGVMWNFTKPDAERKVLGWVPKYIPGVLTTQRRMVRRVDQCLSGREKVLTDRNRSMVFVGMARRPDTDFSIFEGIPLVESREPSLHLLPKGAVS